MGNSRSWIFTQYIALTASVDYAVRVYVDTSYTLHQCDRNCDEFTAMNYITNSEDTRRRLDPDNYDDIEFESGGSHSRFARASGPSEDPDNVTGNKVHYFDLENTDTGFYLAIENDERMCVTVSRVLVYTQVCPATESGLVRYPATLRPVSGSVGAVGACTEDAHHTELSRPGLLRCRWRGGWSNDQTVCECDQGYYQENNSCTGSYIWGQA